MCVLLNIRYMMLFTGTGENQREPWGRADGDRYPTEREDHHRHQRGGIQPHRHPAQE